MKYLWPTIFSFLICCGGNSEPSVAEEESPADWSDGLPIEHKKIASVYSEARLKSVIKVWQEAVDNHDFDAFESIYATRFEGLKNGDGGPVRYRREGWLTQKRALFAQGVHQKLDKVEVQFGPGVGRVFLEQTITGTEQGEQQWDVVLDLFYEDDELKVFRETASPPAQQRIRRASLPEDVRRFYFVLDNRYVVFDNIADDMDETGALYVDNGTATKPVLKNAEVLSRRYKWALKKKIVIGYADGHTEIVRLSGVRAIAKFGVHSQTARYWDQWGVNEIARGEQLWKLARRAGSVYLVGVLDRRRNKKVLWAQVYNGNMPYLYKPLRTSNIIKRTALQRLKNTSYAKHIQARFEVQTRETGSWLQYDNDLQFNAFRSARNRRRKFAAVFVKSGIGCGAFFGSMAGFFSLEKREPVYIGGVRRFFRDGFVDDHMAYVAIDMDRDSFPEFVGDRKIFYRENNRWKLYELSIPNIANPC